MILWQIKHEWNDWKAAIICYFPGSIGLKLRERFIRKRIASCGNKISISIGFILNNPFGLRIGNNFSCNYNCHMNAGGRITIGHNVLIGPGVKIWSVNHYYSKTNGRLIWHQHKYEKAPVEIKDNVWIAANAFITPGVTIGENSIVAAGAIVTKSVPPNSIVAGNPAKLINQ